AARRRPPSPTSGGGARGRAPSSARGVGARPSPPRPPYPQGLFTTLAALMIDQPRTLDARRSQASYPRDPNQAEAFDDETRSLLEGLLREGRLNATRGRLGLTVTSGVVWGTPEAPDWEGRR